MSLLESPIVSLSITSKPGEVQVAVVVLRRVSDNLREELETSSKNEEQEVTKVTLHNFLLTFFEFSDSPQLATLDALINRIGPAKYLIPDDLLPTNLTDVSPTLRSLVKKIANLFIGRDQTVSTETASIDNTDENTKNSNEQFYGATGISRGTSFIQIPIKHSLFHRKDDTLQILQTKSLSYSRATETVVDRVTRDAPSLLAPLEALWQALRVRRDWIDASSDDISMSMSQKNENISAFASPSTLVAVAQIEAEFGSMDSVLRLDSAACNALNVLPSNQSSHGNGPTSLFEVVNHCRTKMGSRTLERWLRQPSLDLAEINSRQDAVQLLQEQATSRILLRDGPLKGCPDIDLISNKMRRQKAGLADLYRLYQFVQSLPSLASLVDEITVRGEPTLPTASAAFRRRFSGPLATLQTRFKLLVGLCETVLDLDALPAVLRINPRNDETLAALSTEQADLTAEAEALFATIRRHCASSADFLRLESGGQYGFALRITNAGGKGGSNLKYPGIRTLAVLKNGEYFTCPRLEEMGDRVLEIESEYNERQEGLVQAALATALTYVPLLETAASLISELDVLQSFATAALVAPIPYVRPVIHPRGVSTEKGSTAKARIKEARHPILEAIGGSSAIVPNDFLLSHEDGGTFQLVTGPNMGGKSTYLRTLGSIVILAQAGCPVPATSAEITIVDAVLARVGAGDALVKGLSTFMAEMVESAAILAAAGPASLVLVDELGRGTSTHDGFGLAWSISAHLAAAGSLTLFATHFHELTALAQPTPSNPNPSIRNCHVTAAVNEDQSVTMLYRIEDGPCNRSYGIPVARMAGLPASTLREAKRRAIFLEQASVLATLNSGEGAAKLRCVEDRLDNFRRTAIPEVSPDRIQDVLRELFPDDPLGDYLISQHQI